MHPETDLADEVYPGRRGRVPAGVRVSRARCGPVNRTRVEVCRRGLARPMGRYVTLELPDAAALDPEDGRYTGALAAELRAMLPPEGLVLVAGAGNRRVTADALGPRTAGGILATRGLAGRAAGLALRPVAALAPGAGGVTGAALAEVLQALTQHLHPAAVVCVDSLEGSDPARLGRTVQLTDTGLCPGHRAGSPVIDRALLGVPVLGLGIPTRMDGAALGAPGLVLTPRELDPLIRRGAALLALALNQALQPGLTQAELCWLAR